MARELGVQDPAIQDAKGSAPKGTPNQHFRSQDPGTCKLSLKVETCTTLGDTNVQQQSLSTVSNPVFPCQLSTRFGRSLIGYWYFEVNPDRMSLNEDRTAETETFGLVIVSCTERHT